MLTEAVVKYMDYLDANHVHVASYQESVNEPQYHQTITELSFDPEAQYTILVSLGNDTRTSRTERLL